MSKIKSKYITTFKSRKVIEKELRRLRKFIDENNDPLEVRIAYSMECAVWWMIKETKDWGTLVEEAKDGARLYREFDTKKK